MKFSNLEMHLSFFQKQLQLHEEKVKFLFCDFSMTAATSTQCVD